MAYFRRFYRKNRNLKSKKNFTRYDKIVYRRGIKQPQNRMQQYAKPPTLQKVIQIVNKAVNKNVENKMSNNVTADLPICQFGTTTPIWWLTSFDNFFDIGGGVQENQRIGNRFKLKSWKIKCLVSPATDGLYITSGANPIYNYLPGSYQGTLKVFLGKLINGSNTISTNIDKFYQNGNTSISPVGAKLEQLYTINNDLYKIYTNRTYKMGMSAVPDTAEIESAGVTAQGIGTSPNNDFNLTKTFTVDVLKYIGKNATIKFNDASTTAIVPSTLEGLCLWALWTPVTGDLAVNASKPNSWYRMTMNTFFEYEDA